MKPGDVDAGGGRSIAGDRSSVFDDSGAAVPVSARFHFFVPGNHDPLMIDKCLLHAA